MSSVQLRKKTIKNQHNYMIKTLSIPEKNSRYSVFSVVFILYLVYISIYGTLSIYMDNIVVRSIKDIMLLLLLAFTSLYTIKNKIISKSTLFFVICFTYICVASFIMHRDMITLVYGLKITVLPFLSIFIGIYIKEKNIRFEKYLFLIFLAIIIAWVYQYRVGLEYLLQAGFEYGVNIKSFNGGELRLPSLNGAPDSYALYLAITGAILQFLSKRKSSKIFFLGVTLAFLILSTIRTAITFWVIVQLGFFLFYLLKANRKKSLLSVSFSLFSLAFTVLIFNYLSLFQSTLFSTSSLIDRFGHWDSNNQDIFSMNGLFGHGIGFVGAASRRTSQLGVGINDYGVDNQFLAFYNQTGIIGRHISFFSSPFSFFGDSLEKKTRWRYRTRN